MRKGKCSKVRIGKIEDPKHEEDEVKGGTMTWIQVIRYGGSRGKVHQSWARNDVSRSGRLEARRTISLCAAVPSTFLVDSCPVPHKVSLLKGYSSSSSSTFEPCSPSLPSCWVDAALVSPVTFDFFAAGLPPGAALFLVGVPPSRKPSLMAFAFSSAISLA